MHEAVARDTGRPAADPRSPGARLKFNIIMNGLRSVIKYLAWFCKTNQPVALRMRWIGKCQWTLLAVVGASACGMTVSIPTLVHASAAVGQSRTVETTTPPAPSVDQLKAEYRRPASIPFPAENPYTATKAELGKMLYFDTRLSAANMLSCASCHNPAYGWGDGQPKGVGHNMQLLGRRSPTIINAAFGQIFMWDGRAGSLEEQALGPIQTAVEMNLPLDRLRSRLKAIAEYPALFNQVFPNEGISEITVAKAIATYERTIVSGHAPFDAWVEGAANAISEQAKRGFVLFNSKARCSSCHSGWNFTDDSFHDIGLASSDIGRGRYLPQVLKMQNAFKTPGLREITRRGPYMHDGSISTLAAVIEQYDTGGIDRASRSELIKPLNLSAQEKEDLVAFLHTLTGKSVPMVVPQLPR